MENNVAKLLVIKPKNKKVNKKFKKPIVKAFRNFEIETDAAASVIETGEVYDSTQGFPTFVCEICVESKPLNQSFNVQGCSHFYCSQCIIKFIESKLLNNVIHILCPEPGCEGVLEPNYSQPILPTKVFAWWDKALCESVISESKRFYCPFKDCSALLFNHDKKKSCLVNIKIKSPIKSLCRECPHCKRTYCDNCKVPWHSEISCDKFQKLKNGEDDLMIDLVERKKWKRCPKCKFYVEKSDGCLRILCRCGHRFCYGCGSSGCRDCHR